MTRLPLASTSVTTAAMVRLTFSERFTEPEPLALDSPSSPTMLAGSKPPGKARPRLFSRPRKLLIPVEMSLERLRWVEFCVWARSSMSMLTVRMSPMRRARWSPKKVRAPVRHRLLALAAACCCSGEGR